MTAERTSRPPGWSGADLSDVRRVVIGQDERGRSRVILDGPNPHTLASDQFPTSSSIFWFAEPGDDLADSSDNVVGRAHERPRAGSKGTRFYVVRIDPGTEIDLHRHPTVDFHCVVDGEVTVILDEGEVTVRAGDVLVMRGSHHGWVNRGDVPFLSVAVMVDAAG